MFSKSFKKKHKTPIEWAFCIQIYFLSSFQTPVKRLMVVGIDVYHDKSRKMGSIAGVVASLNDSLSRYFSTVAIQKQGQEIIDALKIAFMQSLIR